MTILASERDKKKRKVGVSQTRSRNYPILGDVSAARITLLHQDGVSKRRVSGSIACIAPDGQGLLPLPVWINQSLPPYVDAMDDALSLAPGTHHDNIGNRALTPSPGAKFSRKRLEKEKTPQGRLFYIFMLEGQRALTAYSHSMVAGGLPETSYTTREMPLISLMMRFDTWPRKSYGR